LPVLQTYVCIAEQHKEGLDSAQHFRTHLEAEVEHILSALLTRDQRLSSWPWLNQRKSCHVLELEKGWRLRPCIYW